MRILDQDNAKLIDSVMIMLTPEEASELIGMLQSIDPSTGDHIHVYDIEFSRQITALIYTPQNLKFFNEVVRNALTE